MKNKNVILTGSEGLLVVRTGNLQKKGTQNILYRQIKIEKKKLLCM